MAGEDDFVWLFGPFEVDGQRAEVRRNGTRIKLQEQPHRLLLYLLEHPGAPVSREELRQHLWPEDRFVDFEHGLNTAVRKLRAALSDSAVEPLYIETIPRRGYSFRAEVSRGPRQARNRSRVLRPMLAIAAVLVFLGVATLIGFSRSQKEREASIAVLPLENLSRDSEQEFLADGLTEALINDLGRLGSFRVISRTSMMHYKHTRKILPDVAQELRANWIVEGTVLRSGDRVRVTVQLVDAGGDRPAWSETYERNVRDVLSLQDDVASAIARRVKSTLSPSAPLEQSRVVNPAAEEAYLKGLQALDQYTRDGFEKSVVFFEEATRLDPQYAEPWAALAQAYNYMCLNHLVPAPEAMSKMEIAARRALSLDRRISQAHVSLSFVYMYRWSWRAAEAELRTALTLNPNDSIAHQSLGYLLGGPRGRPREALDEMQRAVDLDPLSSFKKNSYALGLFWLGRDDEAIDVLRQIPDGDVNTERRHRRLADIFERKRMDGQAKLELLRAVETVFSPAQLADLGRQCQSWDYSRCKKAVLLFDVAESQRKPKPDSIRIARDFARLANREASVWWLEKAVADHDPAVMYLSIERDWDSLRSDPRFKDILRRAGIRSS